MRLLESQIRKLSLQVEQATSEEELQSLSVLVQQALSEYRKVQNKIRASLLDWNLTETSADDDVENIRPSDRDFQLHEWMNQPVPTRLLVQEHRPVSAAATAAAAATEAATTAATFNPNSPLPTFDATTIEQCLQMTPDNAGDGAAAEVEAGAGSFNGNGNTTKKRKQIVINVTPPLNGRLVELNSSSDNTLNQPSNL